MTVVTQGIGPGKGAGWSVGGAVTPRARAEVRRDGGVEKTKAENISKEKTRSNVDRKKSFKPWDSLSGHF